MLLVAQFPFADSRPFLDAETGLLNIPLWPTPNVDRDFVRSFGIVRKRRLGGLTGWIGESEFCAAGRAISLGSRPRLELPRTGTQLPLYIAFRRFYSDGNGMCKYELGLKFSLPWGGEQDADAKALYKTILDFPVTIPSPPKDTARVPLWQAGDALARLYARSTTRLAAGSAAPPNWWVRAGKPIFYLERRYSNEARLPLPSSHTPVKLNAPLDFDLQHCRLEHKQNSFSMWCFTKFGSPQTPDLAYSDRETYLKYRTKERELRIFLLRLHAEQECLRQILAHIAQKRIAPPPRSPAADRLQIYLNEATRHIARLTSGAQEMTEPAVGTLARQAEDYAKPGEREAILQSLTLLDVRRNIYRKVETHVTNYYIEKVVQGDEVHGDKTVTTENIGGDKITVGDITGSPGVAIGRDAQAQVTSTAAISPPGKPVVDATELAAQLAALHQALQAARTGPAQDTAIAAAAAAEAAAKEGDAKRAIELFKQAGEWAREIAVKNGLTKILTE